SQCALHLHCRGWYSYLDMDRLVALAVSQGCEAIHPVYGFLHEHVELDRRCQLAVIHFVAPQAEVRDLFGDKAAARALAERLAVPLVDGNNRAVIVAEAEEILEVLVDGDAVMLNDRAVGCGRGMRRVEEVTQPADGERSVQTG
ncbi:carbamoyl-phosphate synthase large subunit, partial [Pseudomonas aeruginosa]|uniref:biotin carboxylase N-terminal domain-containing protein n=1 Tax=Pseudomonas aeruginosa TaxID=287 RepID=UPI001DC85C94